MAVLIEQQGQWMRALFAALRGQKHIQVPGVVEVPRPGQEQKPKGRIVTDPGELSRWFARNR